MRVELCVRSGFERAAFCLDTVLITLDKVFLFFNFVPFFYRASRRAEQHSAFDLPQHSYVIPPVAHFLTLIFFNRMGEYLVGYNCHGGICQQPILVIVCNLKSRMGVVESFRILNFGEFASFRTFTTLQNGCTQSNLIKHQRILVKLCVTNF